MLLGAGASKAALPDGTARADRCRSYTTWPPRCSWATCSPPICRRSRDTDFEAAYSQLHGRDAGAVDGIDAAVREAFSVLELPDEATLYDQLLLSLRPKDAVFSFNWDPLAIQASRRLHSFGVHEQPSLHFLHGNVAVGYGDTDAVAGLLGGACQRCGEPLQPSRLLYPVESKHYQDGSFIESEWATIRAALGATYFFTVFGYSAPVTDVEAIELLTDAWGPAANRELEQIEIINRPGADEDELRATWAPFIHTHHYEIHGIFAGSWLGNHPRRSIEAFRAQYLDALFVDSNPIPPAGGTLKALVDWAERFLGAERAGGTS